MDADEDAHAQIVHMWFAGKFLNGYFWAEL